MQPVAGRERGMCGKGRLDYVGKPIDFWTKAVVFFETVGISRFLCKTVHGHGPICIGKVALVCGAGGSSLHGEGEAVLSAEAAALV